LQKETKQKGQHHTDSRRATPRTPIILLSKHGFSRSKKIPREPEECSTSRATTATYVMEERGANIVQVPKQREKTAPELVIPHLNLIVISSRDKQWLLLMEVNASYWTIMFIKLVNKGTHPIVP